MLSFALLMLSLLAIKHGLKDIKSWSKKRFSGSLFQIVAGCCPRECRKLLLLPITSIWTPSLFAFPFCKAPSEYKIDSISDVKSREITSTMLPLYNDLLIFWWTLQFVKVFFVPVKPGKGCWGQEPLQLISTLCWLIDNISKSNQMVAFQRDESLPEWKSLETYSRSIAKTILQIRFLEHKNVYLILLWWKIGNWSEVSKECNPTSLSRYVAQNKTLFLCIRLLRIRVRGNWADL